MTDSLNYKSLDLLLESEESQKKIIEQMLRKQHKSLDDGLFNMIMSLLPGHVYWKDKNLICGGCNEQQAKDLGLKSRTDFWGLTDFDCAPEKIAKAITLNDQKLLALKKPITLVERYVTLKGHLKNQETIWISRKVPLKNNKGRVVGVLGLSIDVTDFRQQLDTIKMAWMDRFFAA